MYDCNKAQNGAEKNRTKSATILYYTILLNYYTCIHELELELEHHNKWTQKACAQRKSKEFMH